MRIKTIFAELDWPQPEDVWSPQGMGSQPLVRLVRDKIERPLTHAASEEGVEVRVGLLTDNPNSDITPQLAAIVVKFSRSVDSSLIETAHCLAWNFCRSKLLVTIEPALLRAWTCWERPATHLEANTLRPLKSLSLDKEPSAFRKAGRALHIAYLATGVFFEEYKERFPADQRADQQLLSNLRQLRAVLRSKNLPEDTVHDLLSRLIFIQFLFQRKDNSGRSAIDESFFRALYRRGIINHNAETLGDVLSDKHDTYKLFRVLNDHFNGDLFPGKGHSQEQREEEWRAETRLVKNSHLAVLADFVKGTLRLDNGQYSLWPLYSFNTIPLDFISSIYEQFVSTDEGSVGAHYTPGHLVDLILDNVLPWSGKEIKIRVLDPACGSGIFLVKVFQRLVHRWRRQNPGMEPDVGLLVSLLTNSLHGIDINPHAIRVASFSLYLAMCDEIEPRRIWQEVKFPRLRDNTLLAGDYFDDGLFGPRTAGDFDLIVGNAPWGQNSLTPDSSRWAKEHHWPISNKQIGTVFLAKSIGQLSGNGKAALLQPAAALLYNRNTTARKFRHKLLDSCKIESIIDFSTLRSSLFSRSTSPVCLIIATDGTTKTFTYSHPRKAESIDAFPRLVMHQREIHRISARAVRQSPWLWAALAWGGGRNLSLLERIMEASKGSRYQTLKDLKRRNGWQGREGYKRGDRAQTKEYLATGRFSDIKRGNIGKGKIIGLLPKNVNADFHSKDSCDDSIFEGPLLLLGKSWKVDVGFSAVIYDGAAIFPASGVYGLRFPSEDRPLAQGAQAVFNSKFAAWFFTLTSGRAANYRPEILSRELFELPIGRTEDLKALSPQRDDYEQLARYLLGLNKVEWTLIEDFVSIDLEAFRRSNSHAAERPPTVEDLESYCDFFIRTLQAGVGASSPRTTIFDLPSNSFLKIRVIAIHLSDNSTGKSIEWQIVPEEEHFLSLLEKLDERLHGQASDSGPHMTWQRVARVLDFGDEGKDSPTAFFVKPNEIGYWSRTSALNDADALINDVVTWHLSRA